MLTGAIIGVFLAGLITLIGAFKLYEADMKLDWLKILVLFITAATGGAILGAIISWLVRLVI